MSISLEQFNKLATKKEHNSLKKKVDKIDKKVDKLDGTVNKLVANNILIKEDIEEIKNEMMTRKDKDEIISIIDELAKLVKNTSEEKVANQGAHNRI